MKNVEYFLKLLLVFSVTALGAHCTITFNADTEQCLGELVQYQCTVTGTPVLILTWRINDDNGTQIGSTGYLSTSLDTAPRTIGDDFEVQQSQDTPMIVSTISFTVQSNINGYTILCEDGSLDNNNFTIYVPGIPDSPSNVTVHKNTFTSTAVNISWSDEPSSLPCFTSYRYSVSSTTINSTTTSTNSTTTSTNAVLEGLVPSDGVYFVEVASIDTANRTNSSNPVCFVFNVPPAVDMFNITNSTQSDTSIIVRVEWDEVEFDIVNCSVVPPLVSYRVTIVNSTDSNDYKNVSLLPPGTTEHIFTGVPTGRTYNVTVIAINGVGESLPAMDELEAPGPFVDIIPPSSSLTSTATSMSSTMTVSSSVMSTSTMITISSTGSSSSSSSTSSSTSTTSTTIPTIEESAAFPVAGVAGGVVAAIVVVLVVIVVIVLVYFLCIRSKSRKSVTLKKEDAGELAMEDKSPEIGQSLYQEIDKPNKPSPKESSTTIKTPKSGPTTVAPVEETPTYQDPSTIKREQASTGDIYTLPGKKSTLPKATETTPGGLYAELDIHTKKSNGGSSDKPVVIQGSTQPVIYADVRGQ